MKMLANNDIEDDGADDNGTDMIDNDLDGR